MSYDPTTIFHGTAWYYARYRAEYIAALFDHLVDTYRLDAATRVVDVGTGTGAPRQHLPDRDPSPATRHRRFQTWARSGVFEKNLRALAEDLRDRGKLDLTECSIDASRPPSTRVSSRRSRRA